MTEKKAGLKNKFAIVRPAIIITTFSSRSVKFAKQQRLNAMFAGLYVIQALALLVLGKSAAAPLHIAYLANDPLQSAAQHHTVLVLAQHRLFDVSLLGLLVTLLFASAVFHALLATALRARYERSLASGLNDLRWTGFAVLGSVLTLVVSLVLGIADVAVLVSVIALCILICFGAMAIEANKRFWPWSVFSGVAMVAAVAALGAYLVGGVVYGSVLPAWTYAAVVAPTVAGLAMITNLRLQIRAKGRWQDYLFADAIYLFVGFVACSAVVWGIFAGVLA